MNLLYDPFSSLWDDKELLRLLNFLNVFIIL